MQIKNQSTKISLDTVTPAGTFYGLN